MSTMRVHKTVGYCHWFRTWNGNPIDMEVTIGVDFYRPECLSVNETTFERYRNHLPKFKFNHHQYLPIPQGNIDYIESRRKG